MSRVVRRPASAVSDLLQAAHTYLHNRTVEADAKKRKGDKKKGPYKDIVEHLQENGELDESTDSRYWYFDDPINGAAGFEWRCVPGSQGIDEDKAQELAQEKGVVERVTHTEVVWDYDELYVLNQQGVITDDELDSVMVTEDPSWSLQVVKA